MPVDAEPFVLPGFFVFLSINHTIIERNLRLQAVKRAFFLSLYEGPGNLQPVYDKSKEEILHDGNRISGICKVMSL